MSRRAKIFTLIFSMFLSSCTPNIEVSQSVEQPELKLNCNYIESAEEIFVTINVQVTVKDKKLFNGSLKGQGIAIDYFKSLDDLSMNSTFDAQYVFQSQTNGTYTFLLFYENSDGVYTEQCDGSLTSITTTTIPRTTTTTIPRTTTTTIPRTTTTTIPRTIGPIIEFTNCPLDVYLPGELKYEFKITSGSSDVTDITSNLFDQGNNNFDENIWGTLQKGYYNTYWNTYTLSEASYAEQTMLIYTVTALDSNGLKSTEECVSIIRGPFLENNKNDIVDTSYDYDKDLYELFNVEDRSDGPYICETPRKGSRANNQYGRCVLWSKWKDYRSFEKADSNWVIACYDGKYIWFWRSNNQSCPND